ncbi:exosome nuclease subunit [Rhodotorula mucilaginosa]|uniref:Exosome nuclease subunit n=1 Tax=Rhodotorula mucilaginosa TaxID=5537 RepID=A0A9P6W825_RHOMI|nr:exosome nuclease subunit [Rhodotorula mucilaginosa]TKA55203.1 hypothetical protein B0A53_02173 [Rhodotorula sp. CCFEE 5036]
MADDLQTLLDSLQAALVPPTKAAARLPAADDLQFERTLSRKLARALDHEQERVLSLAQRVLDWTSASATKVVDADLIREGVYNPVTERVEPLLEVADDAIDLHLGQGKHRRNAGVGALGAKSAQELELRAKQKDQQQRLPARLLHDSALEKPQLRFTERTRVPIPHVDEAVDGVPLWKPLLREKVNAQSASEGGWLATEVYEPKSSYTQTTGTVPPAYTRYTHPYAAELATLTPPARFLEKPDPTSRAATTTTAAESFAKTPFEWVGDAAALERMVDEIRQVGQEEAGGKDLAIDLEHHDYRSWSGMTCLIQLSTRKKDYVIDALEPSVRDGLEALNEFFTDPEWVKVLHGANSDVVWLQRDFGLYIVGLFDTYHATKVLGYSQHSLASLLAMYTDFEADKRYQLADWRIRPLPKEMLHYARSDTHYLLSIYDRLRLALHEKATSANSVGDGETAVSPLEEVYRRSIGVSSITFSLPPFDHETGHFDSGFLLPLAKHGVLKAYATALAIPTLPLKTGWGPSEGRFEVLRSVIRWREQTARDEDESGRYVLSLQGSLQLAEVGAAGGIKDANDVMRVLGGTRGGVSEVARRRKDELAAVITETVERVRGNGGVGSAGGDDDVVLDGGAAASAITSAQLGFPAPEPAVRPIDGLWEAAEPVASTSRSATTVVNVSVAAASAFFGGGGTPGGEGAGNGRSLAAPVVPVAASSSFFGPAKSITAVAAKNKKGKSKARAADAGSESSTATRTEAVKRVHDSLVLGGGLGQSLQPKPIPTENAKSSTTPKTDVVLPDAATTETQPDPPSALTADHTYVPLSGRIPKEMAPSTLASSTSHVAPKPKDSDVIVVSNLKDKPKKRRRQGSEAEPSPAGLVSPGGERKPKAKKVKADSNAAEATTAAPASKPKKEKKAKRDRDAAPIVPHDYSTSTSILDADPAASSAAIADKKERKRQAKIDQLAGVGGKKKGFEIDLSDFRRAPRVANAPKKANVSRSFAK